jgi:hypothetical protein
VHFPLSGTKVKKLVIKLGCMSSFHILKQFSDVQFNILRIQYNINFLYFFPFPTELALRQVHYIVRFFVRLQIYTVRNNSYEILRTEKH